MPRFRKKPVVSEAVRWTGENTAEVAAFAGDTLIREHYLLDDTLLIPTLEGTMAAVAGDWIIRGVAGELYIFSATYEEVSE